MEYIFSEQQLRRFVRRRSYIFDLETGGLDPARHPLVEGAMLRVRDRHLRHAVFAWGLPTEEGWRPLRKHEFLKALSPWAQERIRRGAWSRYLTVPHKARPSLWLERELSRTLAEGGWIWAHNARFDLRFLSAHLTPSGFERVAAHLPYLASWSREMRRLHVTAGREVYQATLMARERPQMAVDYFIQSWEHFRRHLTQAARRQHQGLLLDTQYLMQVALAYAQKRGFIRHTGDLFTGTSLAVYRHAFRRTGTGVAHTAATDVGFAADLLDDYLDLIGRLRTGQPLTAQQQYALAYHEVIQPQLSLFNAKIQFMRAREELLQGRAYEYYSLAGRQVYSKRYGDILELYRTRLRPLGLEGELEQAHAAVGRMSLRELRRFTATKDDALEELLQAAHISVARRQAPRTASRWQQAWARLSGTAVRTAQWAVMRRRWLAAAAVVGGVAWLSLPGKDDEYNTIEGLQHGWWGRERGFLSDFSSGWKGDEASQSWWDWAKGLAQRMGKIFFMGLTFSAIDLLARRKRVPVLSRIADIGARWSERLERLASAAPVAADAPWYVHAWRGVRRFTLQGAGTMARHTTSFALGATAGVIAAASQDTGRIRASDLAVIGGLTLIDMLDDVVWIALMRYLGTTQWGQRLSGRPWVHTLGELLHGTEAATGAFALAAIGTTGIKLAQRTMAAQMGEADEETQQQKRRRKRRRKRVAEAEPGLVQQLFKKRNRHHVMNGY